MLSSFTRCDGAQFKLRIAVRFLEKSVDSPSWFFAQLEFAQLVNLPSWFFAQLVFAQLVFCPVVLYRRNVLQPTFPFAASLTGKGFFSRFLKSSLKL